MTTTYDVGGVALERPFRVRRLGHFQYFCEDMKGALHFYSDLLGFQVTDTTDFSPRIKSAEMAARIGDPKIYFMRYNTDHHSFILSSPVLLEIIHGAPPSNAAIGQITWQVGSLKEVVEGHDWFSDKGLKILRSGRDTPGSNWHAYIPDSEGHANEIYYGIEQIGWNGLSKPVSMHDRGFRTPPPLPQIPEYEEVANARARGDQIYSGHSSLETAAARFDVDGVMLPRPFKIVGIGPIRLLARDMNAALDFYVGKLGLTLTETVTWRGHECYFLRANTEHHSMALYPEAMRKELGLTDPSQAFSFGVRLNNYRQLRAAIEFLKGEGYDPIYLPPELSPGMNYTVFVRDPAGHLVQLYCDMEQIGWDGRPRPASARLKIDNDNWPTVLPAQSDTFGGEQMLGPWA